MLSHGVTAEPCMIHQLTDGSLDEIIELALSHYTSCQTYRAV